MFRPVVPEGAGVSWYPQILADQLILSQPRGADYAHTNDTATTGFSDFPTALVFTVLISNLSTQLKPPIS